METRIRVPARVLPAPITALALLLLGAAVAFWSAPASAARCDRADLRLAKTGKGDRDGDGVSNCRERMLGTSADDADTDGDGLDDGSEVLEGCDGMNPDSDGDGVEDGEDPTPAPAATQKIEAFVDSLTCEAPGSITALGITVALTETTEFEDGTCEDLAAALAAGETPKVEIKILEDEAGALSATEVELEDHEHDDDDHDGDFGHEDGSR